MEIFFCDGVLGRKLVAVYVVKDSLLQPTRRRVILLEIKGANQKSSVQHIEFNKSRLLNGVLMRGSHLDYRLIGHFVAVGDQGSAALHQALKLPAAKSSVGQIVEYGMIGYNRGKISFGSSRKGDLKGHSIASEGGYSKNPYAGFVRRVL